MSTSAFPPSSPLQLYANGFVPRDLEPLLPHMLLRPLFSPQPERIILLAFDPFDRLVRFQDAAGAIDGECYIPYHCWRDLLQTDVAGVVMAHNHPSGIMWPSETDRQSTTRAATMLEILGVALLDHLIFVSQGHFSFRKAGLL